jgi:hypothetical protein
LVRLARLLFFFLAVWLLVCRQEQPTAKTKNPLSGPSSHGLPHHEQPLAALATAKTKNQKSAVRPIKPWPGPIRLAALATANSLKFSPRKARPEGALKPPSSPSQAPIKPPMDPLLNPRQRPSWLVRRGSAAPAARTGEAGASRTPIPQTQAPNTKHPTLIPLLFASVDRNPVNHTSSIGISSYRRQGFDSTCHLLPSAGITAGHLLALACMTAG